MNIYILVVFLFNILFAASKTSEFNITGMMCGFGCINKIEKEINSIKGIKDYTVSFEKSNMIITYDSELINDKVIIDKINTTTNYSCSLKDKEEDNSFILFFKNLF